MKELLSGHSALVNNIACYTFSASLAGYTYIKTNNMYANGEA